MFFVCFNFLPLMSFQTLELVNTVKYLFEINEVDNAMNILGHNLEMLACYIDISEKICDELVEPAQLLLVSKLYLLKNNKETRNKVVEYAVKALQLNQNALSLSPSEELEDGFYIKSIKFIMMDYLVKNTNAKYTDFIKRYVLSIIEGSDVSISLMGYLYDIKEYGLLSEKFFQFLKTKEICEHTVKFLEMVQSKVNFSNEQRKEILEKHFGDLNKKNLKLRCLTILLNDAEHMKMFVDFNIHMVYKAHVAFYMHNKYNDNLPVINELAQIDNKVLNAIFNGEVNKNLVDFMVLNNQTNFTFLKYMGKVGAPFYTFCHSIMNAHTTNDSIFRTNRFAKTQDWNRFLELGGLGLIYTNNPVTYLVEMLSNNADSVEPSAVLSLGLVAVNALRMYGQNVMEEVEWYVNSLLYPNNTFNESINEHTLFGSYLTMGLVKYGMRDCTVDTNVMKIDWYTRIIALFERHSTIAHETAAYALGLMYAGTGEQKVVEMLRNVRKTTEFKRVRRVIDISLAYVLTKDSESEKNNFATDEKLHFYANKYVNSQNTEIIREILTFVNHPNDDTKRVAVLALGMAIGYDDGLMENIMVPLATSHSMYVRAAAGISLGFFSTESTDVHFKAMVINLLEAMCFDMEELVKQQAAMGLGMALMQCNVADYLIEIKKDENGKEVKKYLIEYDRIVKMLNGLLTNRGEGKCVKSGAALGRSMMELGGRSAILSLKDINGEIDALKVHAYSLLCHAWYWNNLYTFIALLILPTPAMKIVLAAPEGENAKGKDLLRVSDGVMHEGVKYHEIFVHLDEHRRQRKYKKTRAEKLKNVETFQNEIKSNGRVNYIDIMKMGRKNDVDFDF